MSIEMPQGLQWLSYLAGSEWPQGDEDGLFALAQDWQTAATDLQNLVATLTDACHTALANYAGTGRDQMQSQFTALLSGDQSVAAMATNLQQISNSVQDCGTQIEYTKLQIISTLAIMAAEIAWALATMWGAFAVPAIEAEGAGIMQMIGRALTNRLIAHAAKVAEMPLWKLTAIEIAKQTGIAFVQDLAIQGYQKDHGHRSGIDWKQTLTTAAVGGISAGVATPIGHYVGGGLSKLAGQDSMTWWKSAGIAVATAVPAGLAGAGAGIVANGVITGQWEFDPAALLGGAGGGLVGGVHGVIGHVTNTRMNLTGLGTDGSIDKKPVPDGPSATSYSLDGKKNSADLDGKDEFGGENETLPPYSPPPPTYAEATASSTHPPTADPSQTPVRPTSNAQTPTPTRAADDDHPLDQPPPYTQESPSNTRPGPNGPAAPQSPLADRPADDEIPQTSPITRPATNDAAEPQSPPTNRPAPSNASKPEPPLTNRPDATNGAKPQSPLSNRSSGGTGSEPQSPLANRPSDGTGSESKSPLTDQPNATNEAEQQPPLTDRPAPSNTPKPEPPLTNRPDATNGAKPQSPFTNRSSGGTGSEPQSSLTNRPDASNGAEPQPPLTNRPAPSNTPKPEPPLTNRPNATNGAEQQSPLANRPATGNASTPQTPLTNGPRANDPAAQQSPSADDAIPSQSGPGARSLPGGSGTLRTPITARPTDSPPPQSPMTSRPDATNPAVTRVPVRPLDADETSSPPAESLRTPNSEAESGSSSFPRRTGSDSATSQFVQAPRKSVISRTNLSTANGSDGSASRTGPESGARAQPQRRTDSAAGGGRKSTADPQSGLATGRRGPATEDPSARSRSSGTGRDEHGLAAPPSRQRPEGSGPRASRSADPQPHSRSGDTEFGDRQVRPADLGQSRHDEEHLNDCGPLALHEVVTLTGSDVVRPPKDPVGPEGMTAEELQHAAGGPLRHFDDHGDIGDHLLTLGHGATALVVDTCRGPADRYGVGAHAYVLTNEHGTIVVRDPSTGAHHPAGPHRPDHVRSTHAVLYTPTGRPHTVDAPDHPLPMVRIGAIDDRMERVTWDIEEFLTKFQGADFPAGTRLHLGTPEGDIHAVFGENHVDVNYGRADPEAPEETYGTWEFWDHIEADHEILDVDTVTVAQPIHRGLTAERVWPTDMAVDEMRDNRFESGTEIRFTDDTGAPKTAIVRYDGSYEIHDPRAAQGVRPAVVSRADVTTGLEDSGHEHVKVALPAPKSWHRVGSQDDPMFPALARILHADSADEMRSDLAEHVERNQALYVQHITDDDLDAYMRDPVNRGDPDFRHEVLQRRTALLHKEIAALRNGGPRTGSHVSGYPHLEFAMVAAAKHGEMNVVVLEPNRPRGELNNSPGKPSVFVRRSDDGVYDIGINHEGKLFSAVRPHRHPPPGGPRVVPAAEIPPRRTEMLAGGPEPLLEGAALGRAYIGELRPMVPRTTLPARDSVPEFTPVVSHYHTPIHYMDDAEREQHRLFVGPGGKLYHARNGRAFDTGDSRSTIFVMDEFGNLYAAEKKSGLIQHSSFFGGRVVCAAGFIDARDGHVTVIEDSSGHYTPDLQMNDYAIAFLRTQGLRLADDFQRVYFGRDEEPVLRPPEVEHQAQQDAFDRAQRIMSGGATPTRPFKIYPTDQWLSHLTWDHFPPGSTVSFRYGTKSVTATIMPDQEFHVVEHDITAPNQDRHFTADPDELEDLILDNSVATVKVEHPPMPPRPTSDSATSAHTSIAPAEHPALWASNTEPARAGNAPGGDGSIAHGQPNPEVTAPHPVSSDPSRTPAPADHTATTVEHEPTTSTAPRPPTTEPEPHTSAESPAHQPPTTEPVIDRENPDSPNPSPTGSHSSASEFGQDAHSPSSLLSHSPSPWPAITRGRDGSSTRPLLAASPTVSGRGRDESSSRPLFPGSPPLSPDITPSRGGSSTRPLLEPSPEPSVADESERPSDFSGIENDSRSGESAYAPHPENGAGPRTVPAESATAHEPPTEEPGRPVPESSEESPATETLDARPAPQDPAATRSPAAQAPHEITGHDDPTTTGPHPSADPEHTVSQADDEHRNDCAPKALQEVVRLTGSDAVRIPEEPIGPAGMSAEELQRAAGAPLRRFSDREDIGSRLLRLGHGATALVVDTYHGPADRHGVGAHAYVLTNEHGTIILRDPSNGAHHPVGRQTPPHVQSTHAIIYTRTGEPHALEPTGHPLPTARIGASDSAVRESTHGLSEFQWRFRDADYPPGTVITLHAPTEEIRVEFGADGVTTEHFHEDGTTSDPQTRTRDEFWSHLHSLRHSLTEGEATVEQPEYSDTVSERVWPVKVAMQELSDHEFPTRTTIYSRDKGGATWRGVVRFDGDVEVHDPAHPHAPPKILAPSDFEDLVRFENGSNSVKIAVPMPDTWHRMESESDPLFGPLTRILHEDDPEDLRTAVSEHMNRHREFYRENIVNDDIEAMTRDRDAAARSDYPAQLMLQRTNAVRREMLTLQASGASTGNRLRDTNTELALFATARAVRMNIITLDPGQRRVPLTYGGEAPTIFLRRGRDGVYELGTTHDGRMFSITDPRAVPEPRGRRIVPEDRIPPAHTTMRAGGPEPLLDGAALRKKYLNELRPMAPRTTVERPDSVPEFVAAVDSYHTPIHYMDAAEREKYRLFVGPGGKLYTARDGRTFDTGGKNNMIFVMDEFGNLYAAEKKSGLFQHSSFFGGRTVTAAGFIEARDGHITVIEDSSGHYAPDLQLNDRAIALLQTEGMVLHEDYRRQYIDNEGETRTRPSEADQRARSEALARARRIRTSGPTPTPPVKIYSTDQNVAHLTSDHFPPGTRATFGYGTKSVTVTMTRDREFHVVEHDVMPHAGTPDREYTADAYTLADLIRDHDVSEVRVEQPEIPSRTTHSDGSSMDVSALHQALPDPVPHPGDTNNCAPLALRHIADLTGSDSIELPEEPVGPAGMTVAEFERAAGTSLQHSDTHRDIGEDLRMLGHGAAAVVVDARTGPADRYGVGAHAYVMQNIHGDIYVIEPATGERHPLESHDPPDVRSTQAVLYTDNGMPYDRSDERPIGDRLDDVRIGATEQRGDVAFHIGPESAEASQSGHAHPPPTEPPVIRRTAADLVRENPNARITEVGTAHFLDSVTNNRLAHGTKMFFGYGAHATEATVMLDGNMRVTGVHPDGTPRDEVIGRDDFHDLLSSDGVRSMSVVYPAPQTWVTAPWGGHPAVTALAHVLNLPNPRELHDQLVSALQSGAHGYAPWFAGDRWRTANDQEQARWQDVQNRAWQFSPEAMHTEQLAHAEREQQLAAMQREDLNSAIHALRTGAGTGGRYRGTGIDFMLGVAARIRGLNLVLQHPDGRLEQLHFSPDQPSVYIRQSADGRFEIGATGTGDLFTLVSPDRSTHSSASSVVVPRNQIPRKATEMLAGTGKPVLSGLAVRPRYTGESRPIGTDTDIRQRLSPDQARRLGRGTTPRRLRNRRQQPPLARHTPTHYMDEVERESHRLFVGPEGRLHRALDGRRFDTTGNGNTIFVMDEFGNLYAAQKMPGAVQHTSFFGGRTVTAAGFIEARDGLLVSVTDSSGHYNPTSAHNDNAIALLRARGLVLPPDFQRRDPYFNPLPSRTQALAQAAALARAQRILAVP